MKEGGSLDGMTGDGWMQGGATELLNLICVFTNVNQFVNNYL
jgi:hypothetical protein